MNQQTLLTGILMLIVGLGVGYVLGGQEPQVGSHMMPSGGMMDDVSMMSQNIDKHFIMQMIPHHEGALAMARIALERSKRPEVLSLAKAIIEAQRKEIEDMQAWYREWFGAEPAHMQGMQMGGMTGDADELASVSQVNFDREFIEQMIPHHEMAIMMAQMLAAATERDEMKQLADNIVTSQSREIDMMRNWLQSWY